ncbi:hypothetical protein B0I37DRAFT_85738 [Chaetomium sp. MPI-CAGE-AT-0009]|nr:hypothetical protein B0I37DRAFT_85738 [Chaetomium sp. MPI-CAGE-AT-0009]
MVGSALALSLIGLSAVQALPTGKTVEERQIWIGPGSGVLIPGPGELPPCLTDQPLQGQPPCLLPPIVGPIKPSTKREIGKRQIWIGPGDGTFTPGPGELPPCLTDQPLQGQPPCLLPPIVGPIKPSTKRDKRQIWIGPGDGIFIPGPGELPPCLTDQPLQGQPPCLLPPIVGPIKPSTKKTRQVTIGDGTGVFIPGQGEVPICLTDVPLNEQPPCMLPPIVGGLEPSTKKRGFVLPPDATTNPKKVIVALEKELIRLQNKKNKTKQDREDIEAIRAALKFLAGITHISAPPGTGSSFTPGKRDEFNLGTGEGGSLTQCPNLAGAQIALQTLMHKDKHTPEERIIMEKLVAFLKSCGITIVKSPDGTFTIIKPSD